MNFDIEFEKWFKEKVNEPKKNTLSWDMWNTRKQITKVAAKHFRLKALEETQAWILRNTKFDYYQWLKAEISKLKGD